MISKKVCVIGDFAVGKTSLIRRYVLKEFSPDYQATLGVNIYKYTDTVTAPGGDETLNQIIWDIEGGKPDSGKIAAYLQGAAGAIVVGDITRPNHRESMTQHAELFQKLRPGRPVVFALNKLDLVDASRDDTDTKSLAEAFATIVIATSAAEGTRVPELFRALGERILEIGA